MKTTPIYFSLYCLFLMIFANDSVAGIFVLPPDKYQLTERHSPKYKSKFKIEYEKEFTDYLRSVEKLISEENDKSNNIVTDANGKTETVLDLIKPFEWKNADFDNCSKENKIGVLLIHGLTDTPFLMRDIGSHLIKNNCILVRSILLPGHGTKPGHLLKVESGEWDNAAKFGVKSFEDVVTQIYIVGFSTGGGLAINYALENQNYQNSTRLHGLILFSPAIELSVGLLAAFADWHKVYSWAYERGKWIDVAPDEDFAKYESFAKNAGDQVYEVTKKRKSYTSKLQVPVFIAISADDSTIKPSGTISYFNEGLTDEAYKKSKLLIYKRRNVNNVASNDICSKRNIICIESNSKIGIASYAHTALPVSSNNFHYGSSGAYYNCIHYIKDNDNKEAEEKYKLCKSRDQAIEYAEIFDEDAKGDALITDKVYRRLTYNPDFSNMMKLVDEFISGNR